MTTIEELKQQITIVAVAREIAQQAAEAKKQSRLQWETENASIIVFAEETDMIKEAEENRLRELTLAIFRETGEKHPAPEVNIREVEKLDYQSEKALDWAINHEIALKLDTPAFEKIVKASPETFSSFVKIGKIATATIATNIPTQVEQK